MSAARLLCTPSFVKINIAATAQTERLQPLMYAKLLKAAQPSTVGVPGGKSDTNFGSRSQSKIISAPSSGLVRKPFSRISWMRLLACSPMIIPLFPKLALMDSW